MANDRNEVHSETDAARAGSTPHIVRWILLISLFGAIVLLSIIWMTGAATQGSEEAEVNVATDSQSRDDIVSDGVLSEEADEFETAEPTPAAN